MENRINNPKISDLVTQNSQTIKPPKHDHLKSFDSILDSQIKISGHAQTRLDSRKINLGQAEWDRVASGVQKAAAKGAKESLVMVDDVALVVSIKNKTVITAVDKDSLKNNVFTNIDSAVIV